MKTITAAELFVFLFKVEDVVLSPSENVDIIIVGQAPMDFDDELISEIKGQKWGSYLVVGMEKFAKAGPWRKGDAVGLGFKDTRKNA